MKIAVCGTGHVGLISGLVLAKLGHTVTGYDLDAGKIDRLEGGVAPFFEPGLQDLLEEQMSAGRITFTHSVEEAAAGAEVAFICVGTPSRPDGTANLSAVEATAREVAPFAAEGLVMAEKSTVPAGTAQRLQPMLVRLRPDITIDVVSNPEFLREGTAIEDSLHPDRILVGSDAEHGFEVMRRVYAPLLESGTPLVETDVSTAELAKHACNAFLSLKISFANGLARICERIGADVITVADVMGLDPRIGRAFLDAGLGYGGYCFPKDLAAFERLAAGAGYPFGLLGEIARINDDALDAAVARVMDVVWNPEGKRVALLGLSYKPGTDDTRFSPSMALARRLLDEGMHVVAYDPQASVAARAELPQLELAPDAYAAATGAYCLILGTAWEEFRDLGLSRLHDAMAQPVVVDGRNLFSAPAMRAAGFTYYPTGRPALIQDS